jgi:hypothetical protein
MEKTADNQAAIFRPIAFSPSSVRKESKNLIKSSRLMGKSGRISMPCSGITVRALTSLLPFSCWAEKALRNFFAKLGEPSTVNLTELSAG